MGENSFKRSYFIHGKRSMDNFNTIRITQIFMAGKTVNAQEKILLNLIQTSKDNR